MEKGFNFKPSFDKVSHFSRRMGEEIILQKMNFIFWEITMIFTG